MLLCSPCFNFNGSGAEAESPNRAVAVAGCRSAGLAARTARRRPPVSACPPLRSPARLSGVRTLGLGAAAQVALVARPDRSRSAAGQGKLGKGRLQRGMRRGAGVPPCPCSLRCELVRQPLLHDSTRSVRMCDANWERLSGSQETRCELVFTLVG